MKEIEKLSIGGYAFTLEKDAAALVEQYLKDLEAHYLSQPGGKEIMEGIEERMAELLIERCGKNGVVTVADIRGFGETSNAKHAFYGVKEADEELAQLGCLVGVPFVGRRAEDVIAAAKCAGAQSQGGSEARGGGRPVRLIAVGRAAIPAAHAFAAIIKEERLRPAETKKLMDNAFRDGVLRTTGTDIDKILPAMSRFGGGRSYVKTAVIQKLKEYFEKYMGV